jgi:hypothetical protein
MTAKTKPSIRQTAQMPGFGQKYSEEIKSLTFEPG